MCVCFPWYQLFFVQTPAVPLSPLPKKIKIAVLFLTGNKYLSQVNCKVGSCRISSRQFTSIIYRRITNANLYFLYKHTEQPCSSQNVQDMIPAAKEPAEGESSGSWTGGFSQQKQPLFIFPKMLFEERRIYCLCCHQCWTYLTKYSPNRAQRQQHRKRQGRVIWNQRGIHLNALLAEECCLWEGKWALPWLGFAGSHPTPCLCHILQSPAGFVPVLMNFLRLLRCPGSLGTS